MTQEAKTAQVGPAAATADIEDGATRVEFENDLSRTKKALEAQPKVQVKVQEDTLVSINGYQFLIKAKTKVAVPQQVAEILEEAGRI
jgi:hypothetical protein